MHRCTDKHQAEKFTLSSVEIPFSLQIQLQKPSFAHWGVFQGNTLRYNHNVILINDFLIIFNEASSTDPGKAFWSHSTQCSEGPRLKLMIHSHHLVIHIYITKGPLNYSSLGLTNYIVLCMQLCLLHFGTTSSSFMYFWGHIEHCGMSFILFPGQQRS